MANIYTSVIKRIISIAVVFITLAIVSPTIYAQTTQQEKFVVILDAGHGGNDTGAIGSKGKEKNIQKSEQLSLLASLLKKVGFVLFYPSPHKHTMRGVLH